jgi:VIT1/CCC1 family predicted Fe2+/Mn2+ transporter
LALLLGGHSRTLRRTPAIVTLIALAALGLTGARLGGANQTSATVRVTAWGAIAMAVTYLIGTTVGTAT